MSKQITAPRQVEQLKAVLNVNSVKQQFENALAENAGPFIASIIDLYGSDSYLQQCNPNEVIMECLKAATLKLPINKQLGFAYIVPYKVKGKPTPQFQLGYKGYIQLAMRTGQYRYLNAGVICEGCQIERDLLTGNIEITGEPTSDKAVGYFAYMELLNGFSKTVYMTRQEVEIHAKKYSASYNSSSSAWKTNFDDMAMKTMIRQLLSKYGYLSTDMISALTSDEESVDNRVATEIDLEANSEVIDLEPGEYEVAGDGEPEQATMEGPGF